jgi:ribose transport system substrate-binding protein
MKLAVFTKNLSNPAYAAARLGAERVAGPAGVAVRHFVPATPDDADQQSALVHEALAWGPDAFVFTPVHATRLDGAIAAIRAAGRPIFGFVNPLAPGVAVSYVGASDTRLAADIAEHLAQAVQGRGRIAIVEGPADAATSVARVPASDATLRRHPGLRVVGRCSGGYQREPARLAFARLLAGLPAGDAPDAVLAANDIMAIGVLDALAAAGRTATVVGVNAIPQAIDAIVQGRMLATADFNAMQMCALATECAIRHVRGEAVPAEIELPAAIVDRHNVQRWNLPYEQRALLSLKELAA